MLRATTYRAAPVFLQVMDVEKFGEVHGFCRKGVAFSIKFELGEGVEEMGLEEFRRRLDDEMRQHSRVYDTVQGGKILTHMHKEVDGKILAYHKYIVCGKMRGGYMRNDMKFGLRASGHNGGKLRAGLPYAGDEL
uniref:Uncharacterized protein n=1 Tax=Neobodo designis TaxID=312471 RepID=A0A7S1PLZ9_NEODS|mmetsp:Transcript_10346/g.32023  ORF Transcript_10346/g.32023 Transcript_10346/m.32023 type:complete len:135 (+) Transcript_10346:32-436(+)